MVSLNLRPKDELSKINYELMADKYQMYKYYPKYFHNDIQTPTIKRAIGDKPVYSKANEHLEDYVNPGVMKIYETELNLESGKLKITKENNDGDEARPKKEKLTREQALARRKERHEQRKKLVERARLIESKSKTKPTMEFNNPFSPNEKLYGLKHSTINEHPGVPDYLNENIENLSIHSDSRKNSVASKLISFISNNSDDYKLERTNSYDQTKSSLTSGRKRMFSRSKRFSDQIGMYNIFSANHRSPS